MPWLSILRHVPDVLGAGALLLLAVPILIENLGGLAWGGSMSGQEDRGHDLQDGSEQHQHDRSAQ